MGPEILMCPPDKIRRIALDIARAVHCNNCSFPCETKGHSSMFNCVSHWTKILESLNKQEPKLMTVSDLYGYDVGFLQYRDDNNIYPVLIANGGPNDEHMVTLVRKDAFQLLLDCDDMNIGDWRIWDQPPTKEQMENTPWE